MKIDLVIVDDSNIWLSVAERLAMLHPLVENVAKFQDPMDAWVHLQISNANVLMTDMEMPMMDGFSFVTMFGRKLNIISSSTRKEFASQVMKLGCTNFLSKPFSKEAFDLAITDVHQRLSSNKVPKPNVKTYS